MDTKKLLHKINKFFRSEKLIAELFLENYEEFNIYFRIGYNKKRKCYRLSWFDLNLMETNDVEKYLSFEYIPDQIIEHITNFYANLELENKDLYDKEIIKDKVHLKVNLKTKNSNYFETTFYKYIPFELKEISDIISIILNTAPRKLQEFLFQLHARLNGEESKYNYKTKINFDLINDDIDSLFDKKDIELGKALCEKVVFLERIDSRFFAVVANPENLYLNIVDYNDETKEMSVHCSCSNTCYCPELYATLNAIKNNQLKKFFKVRVKNEKQNILVKYMTYDFIMCVGTLDEDKLLIVNNNGNLDALPIFDENGNVQIEIIDDSEEHTLENAINNLIN